VFSDVLGDFYFAKAPSPQKNPWKINLVSVLSFQTKIVALQIQSLWFDIGIIALFDVTMMVFGIWAFTRMK
jgi:hypothetical protein